MDHMKAVDAWAHANPYVMLVLGLASAHRRLLFRYAILAVLKLPWARALLLGHADEVLADVDDFRAELKADLDAAKTEEAKPSPK